MVRKLKKNPPSVSEMLKILPQDPTKDVLIAALHVCSQHKDLNTALLLLEKHENSASEAATTLVISIAGKCGDYRKSIGLLRSQKPSIASCHACLAACGRAGAWKECLEVYYKIPDSQRTVLTANIVLSAMAKAHRGLEALDLFEQMKNPNRESRLKTLTAFIGMKDLEAAHQFLMKYGGNEACLLDRLTSAYAKACNFTMVEQLNAQRGATAPQQKGGVIAQSFEPWHALPKFGRGRQAYWKLGTYKKFIVALHPNRNPAQNGMKLLLLDPIETDPVERSNTNEEAKHSDNDTKKIGFLLMQNTADKSSLLGVFVHPSYRKKGLSKTFLALWMHLCLEAELIPLTGVMNKPLICLTLQHTFAYTPLLNRGITVQISCGPGGKIVLYSPTKRGIKGAFSPKDIKREGLVFSSKPTPNERTVRVGSALRPPSDLQKHVNVILQLDSSDECPLHLEVGQDKVKRMSLLKTILCGIK